MDLFCAQSPFFGVCEVQSRALVPTSRDRAAICDMVRCRTRRVRFSSTAFCARLTVYGTVCYGSPRQQQQQQGGQALPWVEGVCRSTVAVVNYGAHATDLARLVAPAQKPQPRWRRGGGASLPGRARALGAPSSRALPSPRAPGAFFSGSPHWLQPRDQIRCTFSWPYRECCFFFFVCKQAKKKKVGTFGAQV